MKRITSIIACLLLLLTVVVSVVACNPNQSNTDKLVVYNWADYIYDYEEDFKKYYQNLTGKQIEITYVTFDTNETMLTKIMNNDSAVDVICPSEYAIQKLMESNYLVPLNYFDQQTYVADMVGVDLAKYHHNSGNVEQQIEQKVQETFGSVSVGGKSVSMTDYMVPYMYGTLGILYNKQKFEELGIYDKDVMNKANWGILFNDDGDGNTLSDGLTDSILMKDSIRDSYAATLFYMLERGMLTGKFFEDKNSPYYGMAYNEMPISVLINAVDDQLIDLCSQTLINQKDQLFGYEVDFGKDDLLKGNAFVDLAWSGDALYAVEESWDENYNGGDYRLSYYVPNNAGNVWFDGWVIPKTHNPEHLTAAKLFINFLNSPYVAAQNMLEIGYTSAVSRNAVRNDLDARAVLAEGYVVYAPEYWSVTDENGNALTADDCDYASWAEFEQYFFDSIDAIDNSNWRYPFDIQTDLLYNRNVNTLGVMKDFGINNKKVVTMWNKVRSVGTTAWPLLVGTIAVLAVAVGVILLVVYVKKWRATYVKVQAKQPQDNLQEQDNK